MGLDGQAIMVNRENINRLLYLYGEMDAGSLSRVINKHLKVAIDEIEEGCSWQRNEMVIEKIEREYPGRGKHDFEEY